MKDYSDNINMAIMSAKMRSAGERPKAEDFARRLLAMLLAVIMLFGSTGVLDQARAYASFEEADVSAELSPAPAEETGNMPEEFSAEPAPTTSQAAAMESEQVEIEVIPVPEAQAEPSEVPASARAKSKYAEVTPARDEMLVIEPAEIKEEQITLPVIKGGRIRLAEAWSLLDCGEDVLHVALKKVPSTNEGGGADPLRFAPSVV